MKRKALSILLAILMAVSIFALSSCEILFPVDPPIDENDEAYRSVYELYVDYAASNGQTPDSYEEWLDSIRGEDGKDGHDGKDGQDGAPGKDGQDGKDGEDGKDGITPSIGYNGNWWIGNVDTGVSAIPKNGQDGADGKDGADGANGKDGVGITKIEKISSEGLVDTYEITYTTGTKLTFTITNGANGSDGKDGEDGAPGQDGEDGTDGITPLLRVTDGYWEVSYDNGQTWSSLGVKASGEQGPQGEPGKDGEDGKDGVDGTDGKDGQDGVGIAKIEKISSEGLVDTFEITYTDGTKTTFTITNGANGEDGKDGQDGAPGQDGEDGKDGVDGEDGKDGADGVGISSAEVNADGELVLYFTNGTSLNLGRVVGFDGKDGVDGEDGENGKDGADGVGIADVAIVDNNLVITLTNGSVINLGNIKGEDGKDGADGEDGKDGADGKDGVDGINGKDGVSIVKSEINANGELVLTYSDGTSINLGRIVGTDGKDGAPGQNGQDGEAGKDGVDGKDGVGISSVIIDENGYLILTLTDGTVKNLGKVVGSDGKDGNDGEDLTACEHEFGEWIVDLEPTCDSIGVNYRICTKCSAVDHDYIEKLGHNLIDVYALVNTCAQHTVMTKCTVCNAAFVEEREIAVEHNIVIDPAVEATCTTTGLTEGSHCSVCGEVFVAQNITDIIDHNYVDGTCIMCGKEYFSEGLVYKLNDDGESYTVLGLGECTDTNIIIPATYEGKPVTTIGNQAFRNEKLTSVIMPDSITTIESMAFMWCTSLTHITISKNVTVIDQGALAGCTSLTSFYVDEENTAFKTIDGNVYTIDGKTLVAYALAKPETEFIVPDGVEVIGRTAFGGGTALHTIILPNSLTAIGQSAFYGNENLKSIIIPIGVIEMEWAFSGCTDLTIYCEAESQLDGWQSDWNNSNCVYYYSETEPAEEGNFWHYVNGEVVVWPAYVEPELAPTPDEYFTFTLLDDGTYSIKAKDVNNMPSEVVIPSTYNGKAVSTIDGGAFYNCSTLVSVIIPNNVIIIKYDAFSRCANLANVSMSNITSIGYQAFWNCTSLANIVLPDSVTSIGGYAFEKCSSLINIIIGNGVISIGNGAFRDCTNLTEISIPHSVTSMGGYVFQNCSSLNSVILSSNITLIDARTFYDCRNLTSIDIPNSVISIGKEAFSNCEKLISMVIPNNVTSIGNNAFHDCFSLTSLVIPNSVASIGDGAFYSCSSLTEIVIPDSVTSIGDNAFGGCQNLYVVYNNSDLLLEIGSANNGYVAYHAKVLIDNSITTYANDGYGYTLTDDGFLFREKDSKYELIAYAGGKETVTLPIKINNSTYSICALSGVRNVIIPEDFAKINSDAFIYCYGLTNVVIPASVTSIGYEAFYCCSSLTEIVIPDSVTIIDYEAFAHCSSLTSVVIGNNVTYVGPDAFSGCKNITDVYYTGTEEEWAEISIVSGNEYLTGATIHYNYVPEK